jgi:squalene cyclase
MTAFVLTAVLAAAPAQKGDEEFQKEVATAREKAIDFLKKQQNMDGTWEGQILGFLVDMEGGQTALAALALLEAGVPADDKALAKAIEYLEKLEPKKTYVVGLQTQVLAAADPKKYKGQIQKNADWLVKHAIGAGGGKIRGWSYPGNAIADGSNTHFAVMGLHAATQAGANVDPKVWLQVREMYRDTQTKDGGWTYYQGQFAEKSSMSMTTAALAGLTVSAEYDKGAKKPDPAVEKGMKLLVPWDFEGPKSTFYALFTVAELGRAIGANEFKDGVKAKAWYREGVEKLLKTQRDDGAFATGSKSVDGQPVLATAFGLYFLGPVKK